MPRVYLAATFTGVLVTITLVYRWYVRPRLEGLELSTALQPLILLHCGRFIGPISLVPGVTLPTLAPEFAVPQAWGDYITAALALAAVVALRARWRSALLLVWLFSAFGIGDLVYAAVQASRFEAANHIGAMYYLLGWYVPALVVTHGAIVRMLITREPVSSMATQT
ncbi:MAG: hypothetical protein AAF436_10220 [Myxococcota bacterium]